jgi:hypothetical protein
MDISGAFWMMVTWAFGSRHLARAAALGAGRRAADNHDTFVFSHDNLLAMGRAVRVRAEFCGHFTAVLIRVSG